MKSSKIRFTPEAARLFSKLHPENKKLIKSALQELRQAPYSGHDLQEELSGFKSFKSKRYRIVYKVNEEEHRVEVYFIGPRKDIYEQFKRLLNQLT
jgi:mRNA-degrading endonuclease RelE of RelBE toxin-antitoxin system